MSRLIWVPFVLITAIQGWGQSFMVGTGRASIEPDASIFSTALAGYGLPREGRFSITWKYVDDFHDVKALTTFAGQLYAITSDDVLLSGTPSTNGSIAWQRNGSMPDIVALFPYGNELHAIRNDGQIIIITPRKGKLLSKTAGTVQSLKSVTAMGNVCYGVDDEGTLYSTTGGKLAFKALRDSDNTGRITALTSDGKKLYAVNEGDSLLSGVVAGGKVDWTMIGRNNGATYTLDIRHLQVLNDRLYAVSKDNKRYVNTHRSDGDLSTMAMAIGKDGKKILIISADLCGFEHTFTHAIREQIAQDHNIHPDAIMFNATHTHFSPVAQSWPALGPFYSAPDAAYMQLLRDAMVEAATKALQHMEPATLSFARGATQIGRNRRSNIKADAPYDNTLDVIVARNAKDAVSAMLFITGCHPVFRNDGEESFTVSANYPGIARDKIREDTGAGAVMFIQGFGGDINPQHSSHKETGEALAADVLSVVQRNPKSLQGPVQYTFDTLALPIETWSREKIVSFREENAPRTGNLEAERNVRWADVMLNLYDQGNFPTALPLYIQTLTIGDWKLVGLSREVVNEYGPAVRNIWPEKTVSVAGYCNDVTSYLPADWHISTGVYEGSGSFYWYNAPGVFPLGTMDRIVDFVSALADR